MKSMFAIAVFGLFGGTLSSSAATIVASYKSYSGGTVSMSTNNGASGSFRTVGGGMFTFQKTGGTYTDGPEMFDVLNNKFYTICFEPLESISGGSFTWEVGDLAGGNSTRNPFSALQVSLLTELFGRHWSDLTQPLSPAKNALSMQVAVWEIVQESSNNPLNVSSGQIQFSSASIAGTLSQAQDWLDELPGPGGPMTAGLKTMVNRGKQDYIFQIETLPPQEVPEPTHLLGGGLLALLALRRRLS